MSSLVLPYNLNFCFTLTTPPVARIVIEQGAKRKRPSRDPLIPAAAECLSRLPAAPSAAWQCSAILPKVVLLPDRRPKKFSDRCFNDFQE
jgi:hypothetical protein